MYPNTKAKAAAVAAASRKLAAAKAALAALERPGELYVSPLPGKFVVGDVGRLERGAVEMLQVIDGDNMLVTSQLGSDTVKHEPSDYEG